MITRIGPRMRDAYNYVREQGGVVPSAQPIANAIAPSQAFGYRTVDRCLEAGILIRDPNHPKSSTRGNGAIIAPDLTVGVLASMISRETERYYSVIARIAIETIAKGHKTICGPGCGHDINEFTEIDMNDWIHYVNTVSRAARRARLTQSG